MAGKLWEREDSADCERPIAGSPWNSAVLQNDVSAMGVHGGMIYYQTVFLEVRLTWIPLPQYSSGPTPTIWP